MKKAKMGLYKVLIILICTAGIANCEKVEEKETTLNVSPTSVEFMAKGGTDELRIISNSQWTISNTSDWCTESKSSSEGNGKIILTAIANNNPESRSTILILQAKELSQEIQVTQKGTDDTDTIPEIKYDKPPDNTGMRELSSVALSKEMGVGLNLGNSLDALPEETSWNPLITKSLIDSIKAAGFTTVRIPVAWSKFSDESTFIINYEWMDRIEEVVNYVLDNDMYAIINNHWDGGWMQPIDAQESYVNNRLAVMWKQIATHFRDYDDHLLFAGSNEVMVKDDYRTPKLEYYTVQNGFNQTFITTVRKTGGRNAYRHLVVQGFNTNIDHTVNFAIMPTDVVEERMMMEVHYYDPYNFALNEKSSITQWGKDATDPALTETWANEAYADAQFQLMKANFVDKGIAVILGEYGAISRTDIAHHAEYRRYYMEYITSSLIEHGCVPIYWDNGYTGNHGLGIFDRTTGKQIYPDIIEAIVGSDD